VQSLILSILALFFSATALAVSIASYRISRRNFIDERLIVLRAKFDDKSSAMELSPAVENVILQSANVHFPTELSQPTPIRGPSNRANLFEAAQNLKSMLAKMDDYKFDKNFLKVKRGYLPILINSFYVAKGAAYGDVSLYMLHFVSFLGGETSELRVTFESLMFLKKLSFKRDLDAQAYLDKIYKEQAEGQLEIYAPSVTEIRIK